MSVNEVLQFVDKLVFEQTGKHLDHVQKSVVQGTWERQTYDSIADKCHVTKNHVGDVGYKLWQLLSEQLEEDINKRNFRSTLERLQLTSSPIIIQNNNHNFNFGSQEFPNIKYPKSKTDTKSYLLNHDLTIAPRIIHFYDRETELKNLSNWILNQNIPLISVLGLSGIGKTTLVKRFIDLNLEQFEVIIWKNLKFPKYIDLLLDDLLNICKQEPKDSIDDKFRQLLDLLIDKKCLIVLDDVQDIFVSSQFSGQYQFEYYNYQNLFKMITEAEHQSHVILISSEQCSEMHCLDEELYPIKCLELFGIENVDILNNKTLKDEDRWLELINLYEGNIVYLKDIAILIKDIYSGKVSDFLSENSLVITKNMQYHFRLLFDRLSPVEQQFILEFSKFDNPVSREDLRQNLDLSLTDFMNSLQSLQQRYLVRQINQENIFFNLSPVFREYVRHCC
ncbi:ATP-binding protein [Crocosphaera sp. UHCC 0190]|uniref:ATP-binding protein n=1 Tax=Crocosphaera sp. UHCC 0190 TaxID=3110246 RepID=UPI002B204790|nr:ATP-binding protein [Crocosphaera sp. UHCC 0190]MEA5508243.1 ATP-binding protein [Crocosphaera sp. UHCC 0190]